MMAKDSKPESKEYSLKPIESQLLQVIMQQQNALLSNTLSFIAIERLAVQVGPNTRFNLNEDFTKVTIVEEEPAEPTADESAPGDVIETPTNPKKG